MVRNNPTTQRELLAVSPARDVSPQGNLSCQLSVKNGPFAVIDPIAREFRVSCSSSMERE